MRTFIAELVMKVQATTRAPLIGTERARLLLGQSHRKKLKSCQALSNGFITNRI